MVVVLLLILSIASGLLYWKTSLGKRLSLMFLSLISLSAATMFAIDALFTTLESECCEKPLLELSLESVVLSCLPVLLWAIYVATHRYQNDP